MSPIAQSCDIAADAKIVYPDLVNLYGCKIGSKVFVGPFVEIQKDASVGDLSRVQSHVFICEGVHIGKRVFVGHGVIFINDRHPKANNPDWKLEETFVEDDVSIGSGAIILCGIRLGAGCSIGAGAVVTKDVAPGETVCGVPARVLKR
ncbi:MAG TPA: N-acetyltransferase [Phycisphaerales bacterium]|nr:N-acetyltransferase [Phycisphaerales bacterium]